jgi:hypothetical protein
MSLNKSNRGKVAVQPKEMDKEYFDLLVGTRHTNLDNGLVYETTKVKLDRQDHIAAYRRLVVRGKLTGKPYGPYLALMINVDAREWTSRREPQTLVMILVKALQKAPNRQSVNIGSLHKSSSLIHPEGR